MLLTLAITTLALLTGDADSVRYPQKIAPSVPVQFRRSVDSMLLGNTFLAGLSSQPTKQHSNTTLQSNDTGKYLPDNKFMWAGEQRYILGGSAPLRVTDIKPATIGILGGSYLGVLTALHFYQENTFWRRSTSFRVRDNWDESLGANYGGHMMGGYFLSYLSTELLLSGGVSTKLAPIYGSLMGLGYQTYVEVLDGYGSNFEFSPYETYAQTFGVAYFLASQYSPFLQNFVPKCNYYPSSWYNSLPKGGSLTPIDDYSAWNFWISINVPNLTDGALQPYWPDWLELSVGYGARNLDDPNEARIVTLSLDYNLVRLLPDGGPNWNWFKRTLNFLKLPSPTIEWRFAREHWSQMGPARFYLLYPFPIRIGNVKF